MQAVILAAGRGTRLQPLTDTIPKAMVVINGKPMLEILIDQLKTIGITDIVIIVHYLKKNIIDYFGNGEAFGVTIHYAEQKEMKGTADAILCAEPFIHDDKFLCVACDSLFETKLLRKLISHKSDGVITCKEVLDPSRYGILEIDNGRVVNIIEKPVQPPSHLAGFMLYVLPKEIFTECKNVKPGVKGELWLTDAISALIKQGKFFTHERAQYIIDIGTHEQLAEAHETVHRIHEP